MLIMSVRGFKKSLDLCIALKLNVLMHYNFKYFKSWLKLNITIDIPVVYMAQDVMILMRANPLQGTLEGVGPEIRDFVG
jgi:hypothetical protein